MTTDNADNELECLWQASDMTHDEYQTLRQLGTERSLVARRLMARSLMPNIRNQVRPPGELYVPVTYNSQYMIKLVHKPAWGGHILTLVTWDMMIVDIDIDPEDDEDNLPFIRRRILRYYPDDLFYINRTRRGYHLYLVSRPLSHSSRKAIFMRTRLHSDPAHGTNSLYTGCSVRLSRKSNDGVLPGLVSTFLESCGSGTVDPVMEKLYHEIQGYIRKFSDFVPAELGTSQEALRLCLTMQQTAAKGFGWTQLYASSPLVLITEKTETTGMTLAMNPEYAAYTQPLLQSILRCTWSRFIKYQVIRDSNLLTLLTCVRHSMGMNNLYRIFEDTPDYAVGVHVQDSLYFIVYRDLLFVDYDHRNRLQIIYQYCRYHPEALFRLVETTKGYHAFLTSHPVPHNDCIPLLRRLCSDPCHLLGAYYRGYSVRINQKNRNEIGYRECRAIGTGKEDPRLYELYRKHLTLYQEYKGKEMHMHQSTITKDIYDSDGPLGIT